MTPTEHWAVRRRGVDYGDREGWTYFEGPELASGFANDPAWEVLELVPAGSSYDRFRAALTAIARFDAFGGGPVAPRETPTSKAMREIADGALGADTG